MIRQVAIRLSAQEWRRLRRFMAWVRAGKCTMLLSRELTPTAAVKALFYIGLALEEERACKLK